MAAEEWQLSWTAEGVRARALLPYLRVNPAGGQLAQGGPGPLAVPFTLALEVSILSIALLAAAPAAAAAASEAADATDELGSLECAGLKVT